MTTRENALLAYRHKTPEYVPCFGVDIEIFMPYPECERYLGNTKGTDAFGVEWTYVPSEGAPMPTPGKHLLEDITRWREFVTIPDLEKIDWEKMAEEDLHCLCGPAAAGAGKPRRPDGKSSKDFDKAQLAMVINGPFERLHACMGMENALCALLEEPEACYEFFGAIADYKIALYRKIGQYYHPDIINQHDDYGTNSSLFMAPETWRELLKPHLKRMVDACHEMGILYEHHSCGRFQDLVPDFVEIGIDAVDSWQACNDRARELKDRYQDRLTFVGGLDTMGILQKADASVEEVLAEYHRCVDTLAPGGSYVLTPGGKGEGGKALMAEYFRTRGEYYR